jgi:hypothetical protein
VVQEGPPAERSQWFSDIEPLFQLLPFENVPLRLKASLRRAIAAFVPVSQVLAFSRALSLMGSLKIFTKAENLSSPLQAAFT